MDLRERLEALHEQNEGPLPTPSTWELTEDELKARYLHLIADGVVPDAAARELGRTGRYMRTFRSERSSRYDPEFAERYQEIMRPDGEHREAVISKARAALQKAAEEGNVRAIEKILMAYDPEFAFLRPVGFQGEINIDKLVQIMPGIPTPLLEEIRAALLEQREQKALPDVEVAVT